MLLLFRRGRFNLDVRGKRPGMLRPEHTDIFVQRRDHERVHAAVVIVGIAIFFMGGDIQVIGAVYQVQFFYPATNFLSQYYTYTSPLL